MIVRAKANTGRALPAYILDPRVNLTRDSEFHLTVGREYVVYAITVNRGHPWYFVCDDVYDNIHVAYPIWKPAALFEIVDRKLSTHWLVDFRNNDEGIFIIAFPEWVQDPRFYERLTDHDQDAVVIFRTFKNLLDEEARLKREP